MEIINLDMTPSTVTPNAHAGQYDASRTVRFVLKNGGVPFTLAGTETITAEITRSDNTEVTVNVANTSSNYVDVVFDDTVCTVKGLYACELRIVDGGVDIGSKNFALLVQRDPYDGAGVHVETVGPADICTFETTLPEPLQSVLANVEATGGNGTPDNPNPIVGHSSANITRCGVNIWNEETANGYYSNGVFNPAANTLCSKDMFRVKPSASYYLVAPETSTTIVCYDENGNFLINLYNSENRAFTVPNNCYFINWYRIFGSGGTYEHNISINSDSTDTAYHPYNGQTYTIAFGQTVYGGVLDVTRGKLTVTHGYADLGTLNYIYYNNLLRFAYRLDNGKPSGTAFGLDTALCECYPVSSVQYSNMPDDSIMVGSNFFSGSVGSIVIHDESYTSVPAIQTALSGQIVVYELATPFDIDLTPEVISAVVGEENNLFADCGETTVKYLKAGG